MEYIVVLLSIALIVVLYFKSPNKVQGAITTATIEVLRENEAEIVQGIYNKLPIEVKEKVDSKVIAQVVDFTLGVAIDVLEETVEKK